MLRGNQMGITIFYASSFACGWVPDIGSQRKKSAFMSARTHMHTPAGHKVAFTVWCIDFVRLMGHCWCVDSHSKCTIGCKI